MKIQKIITVAIAEDEQPICQLIKTHLEELPNIEVVTMAANGKELLDFIKSNHVTAVFLDIEMPDMDGLTTAAKIRKEYPGIFIVFVTAHTKYAAEAYQLEATDYIVKPVTQEAIIRAINKITRYLSLHQNDQNSNDFSDKILVKNNHEVYFIPTDEIIFIEKQLKKTIIHTLSESYQSTEALHIFEDKLSNGFFRCHKSFLININKIEKITPIADRIYEATFYYSPYKVTMRRQKFEELIKIISNSK